MINLHREDNLIKAAKIAHMLSQELKDLVSDSDPFLAEFGLGLFHETVLIEQRLQRALAKLHKDSPPHSIRVESVGVLQQQSTNVRSITLAS